MVDSGRGWFYLPLLVSPPPPQLIYVCFLLSLYHLCGCRVVTPKGIVCQHIIKASAETPFLRANCQRQCTPLKDEAGGCLHFLIAIISSTVKKKKKKSSHLWAQKGTQRETQLLRGAPKISANNVAERCGCWADQTGSPWKKMYVGVFNQSKMANSSRADYNGTILLDTVFVFLWKITGCDIIRENLE